MTVFKCVLILTVIAASQSFPASLIEQDDYELTGGFFEGDMDLSNDEQRNGMPNEKRWWPKATVYFKIAEGLGE